MVKYQEFELLLYSNTLIRDSMANLYVCAYVCMFCNREARIQSDKAKKTHENAKKSKKRKKRDKVKKVKIENNKKAERCPVEP